MKMRHAIAIDFGRKRLRALWASPARGGRLRIRRTLVEAVPPQIQVDDAEKLGQWVGEQLRAAGFPKTRVTVVIGREQVGFKRIVLPTTEDAELPDMVRLAITRELPLDSERAIVDFAPIERDAISTTVVAVAVAPELLDRLQAIAKSADLVIDRIALRTAGTAVLLRDLPALEPQRLMAADAGMERSALLSESTGHGRDPAEGNSADHADVAELSTLAIDVLGDSIEFCIAANGSIEFSRAGEVPEPQDDLAIADAVVTETRRTWMSYRAQPHVTEVGRAVIMGDRRASEYAAEPIATMLECPALVLRENSRIDAGIQEMDRVWPLAGVLLEQVEGVETINLAKPRRAPDLAARTRQRRLVAAGIAIVALLALWTVARQQLSALQRKAEDLAQQQAKQTPENVRYWRDSYKLEHLKQWETAEVDWLQHATYLAQIAPAPDQLVLDSWTGTLDFHDVTFDKNKFRWSADQSLTIVLDGEAKDRETADAFRAALVKSSVYKTDTPGSDAKGGKRMPFGFTYRLRTAVGAPAVAAQPDEKSDHPKTKIPNESLAGRTAP